MKTPRHRPHALAALAAASLLAGCPSLTTVGPARTVGRGQVRAWMQLGAYGATVETESTAGVEREKLWSPQLDAGVSIGVSEAVDVSARAWLGGGSLSARLQLLRSASIDSGVDVAVEPAFGYTAIALDERVSGVFGGLSMPVGLNVGSGSQIVAAPRIYWMHDRVMGNATLAGGSLGLAIRLPSSSGAERYVVPECGVVAPLGGPTGEFAGPLTQCGVGFSTNRP